MEKWLGGTGGGGLWWGIEERAMVGEGVEAPRTKVSRVSIANRTLCVFFVIHFSI